MQKLQRDVLPSQAYDPYQVTYDWHQAGVQWQEDDAGRITWCVVWDQGRFAEHFPGVMHDVAPAVISAVEHCDVPSYVLDQSMQVWEEDQAERAAEWHAEQAFDTRGCY